MHMEVFVVLWTLTIDREVQCGRVISAQTHNKLGYVKSEVYHNAKIIRCVRSADN